MSMIPFTTKMGRCILTIARTLRLRVLVQFMKSMGNVTARKFYERYAPGFYARPTETESAIVRENWIRAKYVRKEFIAGPENDEKGMRYPFGCVHVCTPEQPLPLLRVQMARIQPSS